MTPREEYIRALFQVAKGVHPDLWSRFIGAFVNYTSYEMERMIITVPTNDALVSIGMCRRMRELRDDFRTIEELYQKIVK